jgi:membrane dipeptidase
MRRRVLEFTPLAFVLVATAMLIADGTRLDSLRSLGASGQRPPSAAALHEAAIVFTGHEHITNRVYYEGIDPWQPVRVGVWDYARAKQGGVDVVVENIWADDSYNTYNVAPKQVMRLLETFFQVLDKHRDKMELALTMADVERIVAARKMAVILGLEAGWDFEGDLDVLRLLHRFGLRLAQFTSHDVTNTYVDAVGGVKKWNGINQQGREIIREMNRLGIVIDISHASNESQLQIIEASAAPVTSSHQGLRHFVDTERTMPDETLKALARKGGVLGLHSSGAQISPTYNAWLRGKRMPGNRPIPPMTRSADDDYGKYISALDAAVKERWLERYVKPWKEQVPAEAPLPTIDEWVEQVDYVIKLVGEDHVAMGFDMSRGGGYFRDFDATKYPLITAALVRKGYSEKTIYKVLGGNWLRLFRGAQVTAPGGAR